MYYDIHLFTPKTFLGIFLKPFFHLSCKLIIFSSLYSSYGQWMSYRAESLVHIETYRSLIDTEIYRCLFCLLLFI
jgi:hypothetical protein